MSAGCARGGVDRGGRLVASIAAHRSFDCFDSCRISAAKKKLKSWDPHAHNLGLYPLVMLSALRAPRRNALCWSTSLGSGAKTKQHRTCLYYIFLRFSLC